MTPATQPTRLEREAMLQEYVDLYYKQNKTEADCDRMTAIRDQLKLTDEMTLEEGERIFDRKGEFPKDLPYTIGAL